MNADFYAFGEILWDCLPSGRHAGGAPFNVAAHLAQLGSSAGLISAVGQDALGDELLDLARQKKVETRFASQARAGLPTGTVQVTVDANGNASYEIVQPAAWDEIVVPAEALTAVAQSRGFIFGSLAARSPHNVDQLHRLLGVKGPLKFFDANLRPPFAEPHLVIDLAKHADVLKLNDEELGQLAAWWRTGILTAITPQSREALAGACAVLADATNVARICVTRGAEGAAFWDDGNLIFTAAPEVIVKDTVGAGDAFMAQLMIGLTRGTDPRHVLESACRLGAFVASQDGATPRLPAGLVHDLRDA